MTAAAWRTDTRRIPVIEGETAAPWLRGPVVTRYRTPRARLAVAVARVRRSAFAADVARGWARARAVIGAVAVAYGLLLVLRGVAVAVALTTGAGR